MLVLRWDELNCYQGRKYKKNVNFEINGNEKLKNSEMKQLIDILFDRAIQLRNSGHNKEAIAVCIEATTLYPEDPGIAGFFTIMGGMYRDLEDFENACLSFRKATLLKPANELASLGLYLSFCDLGKYSEAIQELKRYLDEYPANNYKTTLEELLGDLKDGYALDYKDIILDLAVKHGVRDVS
jgi:tetratricopeptide (TPR) repeat protein